MTAGQKRLIFSGQALFLAGAVLLAAPARPAGELPFSSAELTRLEQGEVVLRHEERRISDEELGSLLVAAIWVSHPPEVIWEVLNHPEQETEWIPHVQKSALVSDACPTPGTRVNVTDYRLGAYGLEVYYSLVREYDYEKKTIKAHLDKSRPHRFFRDIQAGWDFFPYQGGTIFQYWSDSKLVIDLPDFISDFLAERAVIAGVSEVAKRCDLIAGEREVKGPLENPCAAPADR